MFDEVALTGAEYDAYVIACLETQFDEEYPDPAAFVTDDRQRFFDSRARLLSAGAAHLDAAAAADRAAARAEAARARALAAFARSRPAALFDRAPGERGAAAAASVAARPAALTEVSEWAVDEAAATLDVPGRTASLLLADAVTLVEGLPATLAALTAGHISPAHSRAMVAIVGPVAAAERRAQVEAAVLPRATRQTAPALRACARRAVARIDAAAAADRLAKAVRDRQVRLDARDDGMSALTVLLAGPLARACYATLSGCGDRWLLSSSAAGHPLPIVSTAEGTRSFGRPGSLVGIIDQVTVRTDEIELTHGDALVLYTDGITDLPPPHGLEVEELETLVHEHRGDGADNIARAIRRSLEVRLPEHSRRDDAALIVAVIR